MSAVAEKSPVKTGAEIFSFVTSGSRGWAKYYSEAGSIFLRMGNLDRGTISLDLTDIQHVSPPEGSEGTRTKVQEGDILISITADLGMVGLVPQNLGEAYINQHVALARPTEIVEPRYGAWFLASKHAQDQFEENRRGAVKAGLRLDDIRNLRVPLPPLPEQRRIVARIEELFSRLDAGVAALRHAKAQLQRYRQSVLAAAVTGQLTQAWREQHPDTEPAEELLERILEQRREQWNGRGKYKEPDSPDVSRMPEIPAAWKWARLDAICAIGSGMSVSKNRKHRNPIEVPYLRVANVQRGHLVLDEVKLMEIEADRLPVLALKKGDVLFNEGGDRDKLGRGWIWEGQIDPCISQNHVFRASSYDLDAILPKFLSHWGNIFGQQFFLDEGTQTTNLASINKGVLSSFPVPIPPLAEQHQIVAKVEARTTLIDHLNAELETHSRRSESLRSSILKACFLGKL